MKKIEAFIRHEAFEPIRTELLDRGFPSLSISEVKGSGRQKGIVETYRGSSLTVNVRPKLKIEVVIEDKDKSLVVETILKHARTGDVGDGKIFVLPVEEAIRIRTGEDGESVLQAHTDAEIAVEQRLRHGGPVLRGRPVVVAQVVRRASRRAWSAAVRAASSVSARSRSANSPRRRLTSSRASAAACLDRWSSSRSNRASTACIRFSASTRARCSD